MCEEMYAVCKIEVDQKKITLRLKTWLGYNLCGLEVMDLFHLVKSPTFWTMAGIPNIVVLVANTDQYN